MVTELVPSQCHILGSLDCPNSVNSTLWVGQLPPLRCLCCLVLILLVEGIDDDLAILVHFAVFQTIQTPLRVTHLQTNQEQRCY